MWVGLIGLEKWLNGFGFYLKWKIVMKLDNNGYGFRIKMNEFG